MQGHTRVNTTFLRDGRWRPGGGGGGRRGIEGREERREGGEEGKDPGRLTGKAQCLRSVIPAPRSLGRKKCCDFYVSLGYTVRTWKEYLICWSPGWRTGMPDWDAW